MGFVQRIAERKMSRLESELEMYPNGAGSLSERLPLGRFGLGTVLTREVRVDSSRGPITIMTHEGNLAGTRVIGRDYAFSEVGRIVIPDYVHGEERPASRLRALQVAGKIMIGIPDHLDRSTDTAGQEDAFESAPQQTDIE